MGNISRALTWSPRGELGVVPVAANRGGPCTRQRKERKYPDVAPADRWGEHRTPHDTMPQACHDAGTSSPVSHYDRTQPFQPIQPPLPRPARQRGQAVTASLGAAVTPLSSPRNMVGQCTSSDSRTAIYARLPALDPLTLTSLPSCY